MLTTAPPEQAIQTLQILRETRIAAPIDIVFECILEQMGPLNEAPDRTPMPMKIEPWPGGRWFIDSGNNTGHFWGVVQSIRPNDLLEIHGPMFMSAPAISHILYRLTETAGTTTINFSHNVIGQIPQEYMDGIDINTGWTNYFERLGEVVKRRRSAVL
jgi:uncharacterized protein YndB with AHSA1/START domain